MREILYSIVPPVLIVISLVGIIIILVKKSPKLVLLEDNGKSGPSQKSLLGKFVDGKKVNNKLLLVLEKITRKFKLFFLKLENIFSAWGESIKQKRRIKNNEGRYSSLEKKEAAGAAEKEKQEIGGEKTERAGIFFRKAKREKKKENVSDGLEERSKMIKILSEKTEEKERKPLEKKDLFEKILIERIAANPKDVEAYERLGEYYFEIENWNYSKECFKQVIKLSPQNRNVKAKMRKLERLLSR